MNEDLTPQPIPLKSTYYRHERPVLVAMQLAHDYGIRIFPSHGMRHVRDGAWECDCMSWRRRVSKREGTPLLPCSTPGKMPAIRDWPNKATSDLGQIAGWEKRNPTANFSCVTGSKSHIWVLDIDGKLGMESLAKLQGELGDFPPTWTTRSGSGEGCHFWWRLPEGIEVHNSSGRVAPGIDVRGHHGQIILPGSRHKSGNKYIWMDGRAPDEVALAYAPEALVTLVLEACKKTQSSKAPPTLKRKAASSNKSHKEIAHTRSLLIGDGEGRGGFHAPINAIAVKFFGKFGPDKDATALKAALKKAILKAPAENHESHEIARYLSDDYLDGQIESARNYIKEASMKT